MSEEVFASVVVATAFAAALCATPLVARLALALGVVDRPDERKIGGRPRMPLLGGLAVALGFFAALAVALALAPGRDGIVASLEPILIGGLLVIAVGALDDAWGLGAWPKLIVQLAAAAIAIAYGVEIDHFTSPLGGDVVVLPTWLGWLVTTGWIVVVTNSINLIDGLDGLCTGVSAIIATTLTIIAWQAGQPAAVVAGLALVGALLGFLPWNFPPARIFVGDTGALFVGYCLSVLALEGYKRATVITFLVPLLALAVPLLDTGLSILRRLRKGKGVMKADRLHMHHRLLRAFGGAHRPAVLSLYFFTACFSLLALSFARLRGIVTIVCLGVVLLLTLRILRNLGFASLDDPGPLPAPPQSPGAENGEAR
jgi:UDP-GlcNAc:undecaprenyl-phosphate GlcNAc-1-phosphate transferase